MTKSLARLLLSLSILGSSFVNADSKTLSIPLDLNISVSGQMNAEKFSQLLQQGFKSVIVNRPDNDLNNQIKIDQLRDIAEKSHVSVIYQPVSSGKITQTDVVEFAKYYNNLPKPVLLICKTGTRSSSLFNQAKSQGLLHE
ncbi:beta-lactamase hydrolase domain-containing protein [Acinetobacter stercoris]|uniref:Beta-lactamase hydrolase-like protein n=1 Tax=Acinetobacter stercoris TaxID=2126983 RepID=A0A2U3MWK0_9GAMM|nr:MULTISPECIES: sulfur transferase domain-containing protein [Acinetobacter]SPL69810.1 Beta-lactamase hydrolase-like protein [Acinetobacter stercoris]